MDSQKPCLPDFLTASSSPPTPAATTWKAVSMSLLWKLSSTVEPHADDHRQQQHRASHSQTFTLSAAGEVGAGDRARTAGPTW